MHIVRGFLGRCGRQGEPGDLVSAARGPDRAHWVSGDHDRVLPSVPLRIGPSDGDTPMRSRRRAALGGNCRGVSGAISLRQWMRDRTTRVITPRTALSMRQAASGLADLLHLDAVILDEFLQAARVALPTEDEVPVPVGPSAEGTEYQGSLARPAV